MNKVLAIFSFLLVSSTVFASHPHQAICLISSQFQDGTPVRFLLQLSSERTYQNGDPNQDVHNFDFQARICDDDNDAGQCSTYKASQILTDPSKPVTLIGMKNSSKTLFEGVISNNSMKGKLVKLVEKNGEYIRTMAPFKAKLNCIGQTWVELKAEDDSNSF